MPKYTTICCATNHRFGETIHVAGVEAEDTTQAATLARSGCASDWNEKESNIAVLGVLEGDCNVLEWDDNGIELPKPQTLLSIKVDFNAWPGASFQGGHIIEIDRETFDDTQAFHAAYLPEVEELLDGLAEDDPAGWLVKQISDAVIKALESWQDEGHAKRTDLVLASGRYKLDGDGEPLRDHRGQEIFDEQFDITVSIIPVVGDEPDEDD